MHRIINDLRSFWREEGGAISTDFAVVAALAAALGVSSYNAIAGGSSQLVANTGFVIGPDGPNYSIDGSGPMVGYTTEASTTNETGSTEESGV